SILAEAIRLVKIIHKVEIDLEKIPLDDEKTFAMLARGETIGLFQLNGSGMTKYLKDLRPTTINDINAMVALYRPGPIESIPEYIQRKHNPALIKYFDPRMQDILDQSYGVITYQDDVMMIAIKLAGYSWLDADKLRKAIGKKIPAEMEAQHEKFTSGLVEGGMTPKKAAELWQMIETFAAYGFNKAHAASYGLVAYETAYMKANFPVEYMCAILTSESGDVEKIGEIIAECKKMNIAILPPSVNESYGGFTVVRDHDTTDERSIRFGLYTIKNLGGDIADAIIAEREANGAFTSITDFFERINHKNLNKKSVEALAKTGALDALAERNMIIGNLETLLAFNKSARAVASQTSLFGSIGGVKSSLTLLDQIPATKKERLTWEKDLLGLYISGHPLDPYREKIEKAGTPITKVIAEVKNGMPVTMAVIITTSRVIMTKKNDRMAFIGLADLTGNIEAVVFPSIFEKHKDTLVTDKLIALQGKVSVRNGEKSIIIDDLKELVASA
ncbi:DNA polymerase III subunit alpha, partial [Patescibacteria group bacterium]|nr:DNA polymerase III subunit alpha [Patescibacteria group bacterium]